MSRRHTRSDRTTIRRQPDGRPAPAQGQSTSAKGIFRTPAGWGRRARESVPLLPLVVVAAILLGTIDDRHVGRAADERQMIWTAVAIAETGQVFQARDRDFTYITADGRSVSRFGIGMSLLQVPAALIAPHVEHALGPGASQPLFLIVPFVLVLLSAALAGVAAGHLGAGRAGVGTAVLVCALGSPLGSYAATGFSEPLQAAAMMAAYAAALGSVMARDRRQSTRRALIAGIAVSVALLAKSSLLAVAPAALLPLLARSGSSTRVARVSSAVIGAVPGVIAWAAIELARFQRLFGSYPGEGFTNPFGDGLWRLLIGPNLGMFIFFPALAVVVWAFGRRVGARAWDDALLWGGGVAPFVALLTMASGWWAWHGVWGWGPRLLVPGVPLLAAGAGAAMQGWRPAARWSLVALSMLINVPGLLQHPVPVANYVTNLEWPAASAEAARAYPGFATRVDADGTVRVSPDHVLARIPQASPLVVFPWFYWATHSADVAEISRALDDPPWRGRRPDLLPSERPMGESFLRQITGQPRSTFWGRGFAPSAGDALYSAVYDEGLADQVVRLQQARNGEGALRLARRLVDVAPIRCNDALVFESYRLLKDREAARAYLTALPLDRRACPAINVVLALFERDAGNDAAARPFLGSVADQYPSSSPLHRALEESLDKWPVDLQSMTAAPVKRVGS